MYIVVSGDGRIPNDLLEANVQVEVWTVNEFFEHASDDEGLVLDEGLFFDVSVLTEDIYEALVQYDDEDITIVYYRYDDKPSASFSMKHDVVVYSTVEEPEEEISEPVIEEVVEEEPEDELEPEQPAPYIPPPIPTPVQQPVYNQPTQPAQSIQQPMYNQPMQQPIYAQPNQPVYTQPIQPASIPQHQAVYEAPVQPQSTYNQSVYVPPVNQSKNSLDLNKESVESVKQTKNSRKSNTKTVKTEKDKLEDKITRMNIDNMLMHDDFDTDITRRKKKKAPAKVILFGSSKGGTGKTFTCLATAYWYAKTHPNERIALADFDIIDGQIGITINKLAPTVFDYYKDYKDNRKEFEHLRNHSKVTSDKFSTNIDFYLAPPQDIPQVTNDLEFWNDVFQKLIENYDVVFFDSGIDYLGKPPISQLYKIADRIIITCNPSINSTKSVLKQFKTLSGQRINSVFRPNDDIMSRVRVVLTRLDPDSTTINNIVENNLSHFAPIVARFENIDKIISQIHWYQFWNLVDETPAMYEQLDKIIDFDDED